MEENLNYNVSFCTEADLEALEIFINKYWKKDHVLSLNKTLMRWQYYDKEREIYNFALAKDHSSNEILGIIGVISSSHFDPSISPKKSVLWLNMWKVRDEYKTTPMALELLFYVVNKKKHLSLAAIGINRNIKGIYRALRYRIGIYKQFFRINAEKNKYIIIKDSRNQIISPPKSNLEQIELYSITKEQLLRRTDEILRLNSLYVLPMKSSEYFVRRYIEHPVYQYMVFGIAKSGNSDLKGLLVLRKCTHNNAYVLRIIDFLGDQKVLGQLSSVLDALMVEQNAEYVDIVCIGIPENILITGGFEKLDPERSDVIVPHYFEPFKHNNVKLTYGIKIALGYEYVGFKGDADQDRPNLPYK